jgi:hypothetical protein
MDELDRLILHARANVIAKLDAATNFEAVLGDVYARGKRGARPTAALGGAFCQRRYRDTYPNVRRSRV